MQYKTQVRIICADDATDFEDQINMELEILDDKFEEIIIFENSEWNFCAMIMYRKEI